MKTAKLRSMKAAKPAASKADDGKLALPFAKKKPVAQTATVDGSAAKARLDRPGRKRADGGPVPPQRGHEYRAPHGNPGKVSRDSVDEAKQVDAESPRSVGNLNALKLGAGVGTALHFLGRSKMALPLRGLGAAAGLEIARRGGRDTLKDFSDSGDAIKEKNRLLDGKVKPGEEDRKSGGRVTKKGK